VSLVSDPMGTPAEAAERARVTYSAASDCFDDPLSPEAQERVRARLIGQLERDNVTSIEANVLYALAVKSEAKP